VGPAEAPDKGAGRQGESEEKSGEERHGTTQEEGVQRVYETFTA